MKSDIYISNDWYKQTVHNPMQILVRSVWWNNCDLLIVKLEESVRGHSTGNEYFEIPSTWSGEVQ